MKAVLLAGGKGSRLAPYTTSIPKPLLPVGQTPILEILIKQLKHCNITDITICVGHLGSLIQAYFGNGEQWGVEIDYSFEDTPLGTAGPIKNVETRKENFIVMNGDLLTTMNFKAFYEFHKKHNEIATIALNERVVKNDFGVVEKNDEGCLTAYREKPESRFFVSMGIYMFNTEILNYIDKGVRLDLPDLILRLLAKGHKVKTFVPDCRWLDIGRPEDYQEANRIFEEKENVYLAAAKD